ncbi:MAG TPA: CocE/NonD family hydrolase [Gemmatimonadaceae bacterium]|nr:CocE/NonD family hydrolase [Gemmatimonadaceae bacterium]
MRRSALLLVSLVLACQTDRTGPRPPASREIFVAAANDDGPPSQFPTGSDTYRVGVFTGNGQHKLDCAATADGGRECNGFLRSDVDKTFLDTRLEIPPGSGPFPLVALIHGYGGSKTSSGDIAARLRADGYAILRYSTRGFGKSWGQVNLADLNAEIGDLRSMIGQVVDEPQFDLNADAVAVAGASYGGGHSWLALVQPTFATPKKNTVHIRAVVPIAPWTDLLYSLLPNGRPNNSLDGLGGLKLSYVNGLYGSGIRKDPERPYPNYPDYLIFWHAYINATEPNSSDPIWDSITDGLTLGRSIWWQASFWEGIRAGSRVPVFQVQGFTDDLFPLPEAKRMLLALQTVAADYPITSYFGDLGHPRARNQQAEVDYVLGLIEPWLAYYLKGAGSAPQPFIYASRTDEPFNAGHVVKVSDWSQLSTGTFTQDWTGTPTPLVNPATCITSGVFWDPFVGIADGELQPYVQTPPPSDTGACSLSTFAFTTTSDLTILGQPTVTLNAVVVGHRVQLNVRLIDVDGASERLITRGTVTLDAGLGINIGAKEIVIPTYGNFWVVPAGHSVRLEISNVDSPYITPSREPSSTIITDVHLRIPTH